MAVTSKWTEGKEKGGGDCHQGIYLSIGIPKEQLISLPDELM